MTFCTLLEWDENFGLDRFRALNERAGTHEELPEGCLGRLVGEVDAGALVLEVWRSPDDAKRFSEQSSPLIAEAQIPPPTRVAAFETAVWQTAAQ